MQPNTPTYDASALATVSIYDRNTYRATFGKEAPDFDITQSPKNWIDPQAASDLANGADPYSFLAYKVLVSGQQVPAYYTRQVAASINLKPQSASGTITDPVLTRAIAKPYLPYPVRDLLPNEKLVLSPFGQYIVERTDLLPTATTGTDSQNIGAILGLVQQIAAKLGIA